MNGRKTQKKSIAQRFLAGDPKEQGTFYFDILYRGTGSCIFSGIQASSPDMRLSGDDYYNEVQLMDLKIVGTLGLTEDDIEAVRAVDGVESAEGAYCTDVICGEERQKVLHIESVNQNVNQLTVTEGRLPQKSGECFLDSAFASGQGYEIGSTIKMRQDKDSRLLNTETYTVVGLGKSPLYISFNRGNTTVGSGEVNGFAYVLPEDFDQEVFTQIYIRSHGTDKVISYTDAYDNLVERLQKRVEGIEKERCQLRYNEIMSEAQDKIADAEKELADGRKEADKELADASKKLSDGEKEIRDGKKELEDGRKKLADAKEELGRWQKTAGGARAQLADGRPRSLQPENRLPMDRHSWKQPRRNWMTDGHSTMPERNNMKKARLNLTRQNNR